MGRTEIALEIFLMVWASMRHFRMSHLYVLQCCLIPRQLNEIDLAELSNSLSHLQKPMFQRILWERWYQFHYVLALDYLARSRQFGFDPRWANGSRMYNAQLLD